jgi:hypothetical protein
MMMGGRGPLSAGTASGRTEQGPGPDRRDSNLQEPERQSASASVLSGSASATGNGRRARGDVRQSEPDSESRTEWRVALPASGSGSLRLAPALASVIAAIRTFCKPDEISNIRQN